MSIEERFEPVITKINHCMLKNTKSNQQLINLAVKDLVNSGGKRLRPIIVILASKFGKYEQDKILKIASALELLHMATLVHDDIIDDAKIRRGEITAQKKFGKNVAVFIGDFLLSKSLNLFSKHLSRESLSRMNKVVKLLCEGEISQYEDKFDYAAISITKYLRRIRRKTALLFGFSTYIGAYESEIEDTILFDLYNFGLEMGMAFQIQDDILDFIGDEQKVGKTVGKDLTVGVYTLPLIYLLKNKIYSQKVKNILNRDNLSNDNVQTIIQMVQTSGALDTSRKMARQYIKKANSHLNNIPDIKAKKDLKYILDYQLKRQY